jgi:restriction endonuclease S subunit
MKIKDIVAFVPKSITPKAGKIYRLYSLPSFDDGRLYETLDGKNIQSNKYIVPDKCILFNKLNVRFKRILRIDESDTNKVCSTEYLPLVVNESKVDYQYCYYLLISDKITNYLCGQNTNTSGSHKRINPDNFLDINIILPGLAEQKRIGKLLSDIDHKIELNRAINQNLEAMAKQLYNYWFVQFDFPNEEGKPYKSSGGKMVWNEKLKREIPFGWHCGNLFEIAVFTNGLACQKFRPKDDEASLPVIKIREMHDGISADTEKVTPNIPESVKVYNGDVLFSWSASLEVMLWAYGLG